MEGQYRENYLQPICGHSLAGVLKYVDTYETEQKIYSKLGAGIVDILDKKAKDNVLTSKQKKKAMNWAEIKKIDLSDANGGNSFLRALYAIYTEIPPRRAMDYQLMKIIRKDKLKGKIEKLDKKFNYLFVNKNKLPVSITIYNYKESARRRNAKKNNNYGQYETAITGKLALILQEYIVEEGLNSNDFLFGTDSNHQKSYQSGPFSTLVSKNIFETFTGKNVDINMMRHAFVSWFLPHVQTYREKEDLTYAMGNTIEEATKTYLKLELTRDYVAKE